MYSLGCVRSLTFGVPSYAPAEGTIPEKYDIRDEMRSPIDQGNRGICVSVCVSDMLRYRYLFKGEKYKHRDDFFYNHRSDKSVDGMSPRNAFEIARSHSFISSYATLKNLLAMRVAIAANGPVLVALPVYTYEGDFWRKTSGNIIGYHAVTLVSYDDIAQQFYLRNSWGPAWELGGFTTFPYSDVDSVLEAWTVFS